MKRWLLSLVMLAVLLLPASPLALAEHGSSSDTSGEVKAGTSTTTNKTETETETNDKTELPRLKNLADKEVNHRLGALNSLEAIVKNARCLSAADKAAVETQIQAEQTNLPQVKTKVDDDTDSTTEKTDVKSITTDFRTYALMVPKVHLLRVADHLTCAITKVTDYQTKLQKDLDAAKTAGKDVTKDQTTMADMTTQLNTASTDLKSALTSIINTTPDQFNASPTIISNIKATLDSARKAVIAALKDGNQIRNDLKQQGVI